MNVNTKAKLLGAIEAGGTKFVCAVAHAPDRIIQRIKIPTTTPRETFSRVVEFFEEAAKEHGAVASIGVASFGPLDINPASPAYGRLLKTTKPGWTGASFLEALAPLKAPVMVDTDVNGAGLGEAMAGAGRGAATLAYVTVGTGIGAGVIRAGAPLAGFSHYELGHIRPPRDRGRDAFPGLCSFHGDCLEGLASGPAIIDRWGKSLNALGPDHEAITLEAEYLSHLALNLVLGHMPDKIIFGGGVMKAPGLLIKLRQETKTLLGGYIDAGPLAGDLSDYIITPGLGDLAGITGAIALAGQVLSKDAAP